MRVALAFAILAALSSMPQKDERKELFDWFDTLAVSGEVGKPLVWVQMWTLDAKGKRQDEQGWAGFLVAEGKDSFTVCNLNLLRQTVPFRTSDSYLNRGSFRPVDLAKWGPERLKAVAQFQKLSTDDQFRLSEQGLGKVELFLLARHYAAKGRDELSREFFRYSKTADRFWILTGPAGTYSDSLKEQFGAIIGNELQNSLKDRSVSRAKVVADAKVYLRQFPKAYFAQWARAAIPPLEKMAEEDARHRAFDDTVAELIYQLRDQSGEQWSNPGECDIFWDKRGEASPAHRLVKLGYPAVPQLIEAVTDDRPSRSVRNGNIRPPWAVLTIGDCATQVLVKIAHRRFQPQWTSEMSHEEYRRRTQVNARKWWQNEGTRGERVALIALVSRGDLYLDDGAELLVTRYPADACAAIAKGLASAQEYPRSYMVASLRHLHSPEARALVWKTLRTDSSAEVLARASQVVSLFDPEGAVRELAARRSPVCLLTLAHLVRGSGIRAVEAALRRADASLRRDVFGLFGQGDVPPSDEFVPGWAAKPSAREQKAYAQGVERMLVAALDDETQVAQIEDAESRLCDVAAASLSACWPRKYVKGPLRERDMRRARFRNIWRKEHGLSLLPVPPVPPAVADPRVVSEVRFVGPVPKGAGPWVAQVRALRGKRLDSNAFAACFRVPHWPKSLHRFGLSARRDSPRYGILVTATFNSRDDMMVSSRGWNYNSGASIGDQDIGGGSGAGFAPAECVASFRKDLHKILSSNPKLSVACHMTLERGK